MKSVKTKEEKISAALKGNQSGVKLKDPKLRQKAYKEFCDHIASGLPVEAFHFEDGEYSCCWATMLSYLEKYKDEFKTSKLKKAKAERYKVWLTHGQMLMKGKYKGGSPTVWQVCMRNMFKDIHWDKDQTIQENRTHVHKLSERIRGEALEEAENIDSDV